MNRSYLTPDERTVHGNKASGVDIIMTVPLILPGHIEATSLIYGDIRFNLVLVVPVIPVVFVFYLDIISYFDQRSAI